MPNHVTNVLIIGGVSDSRLEEIRNAIKGVEEDGTEVAIDFNKIIPMPPEMHITSGGYTDYGMIVQHPEMAGTGHTFTTTLAEATERLAKASPEEREKAIQEGEQAFQNIRKYGVKDWYQWANKFWGTKWGAYSVSVIDSPDRLEIQFDTAWSTPEPVIRALAKKFPDATFSVSFADEDLGNNVGKYTYKGRKVEYDMPEGGSDEAMQLAIEIKGLQDELVKDEKTGEWKWVSEMDDEQEDTVTDALNTLIGDGVVQVKTHDDHTAEIENEAEAKANEG